MKPDEKELIRRCLAGNRQDFKKIMGMYSGKIFAMAINILGNREDAEDVCQDSFLRIYNNLSRFDFQKDFKNWAFAIIYNRCMDVLRKRRRFFSYSQKRGGEIKGDQRNWPELPSESSELPAHLLENLSSRERTALVLWASESYKSNEIADVMSCSPSTARVYLYKARKKIKILLEEKNV